MALQEASGSFESLFPRTRYFEIDSRIAGARYAVWVTVPILYDVDPARRFPVVYEADGNLAFPQSAPIDAMLYFDPIRAIMPLIKVSVGYVPSETRHFSALRNRDLLPHGDPAGAMLAGGADAMVALHYIGADTAERFKHHAAQGAADAFQAFLEDELHPGIAGHYRIDDEQVGLWGYSLGGLFTTHVALKRSSLFRTIGAGSPAIVQGKSSVLDLYRSKLDAGEHFDGRRFHITVALNELTAPSYYQPLVGVGTAELLALAGNSPLPGLAMSSEIIPLESHATSFQPAWFSFLRACYSAA